MEEREYVEKLLDELKMESKHQLDFVERLRNIYDELSRNGFRPLNSLLHQIATWEQNLSLVEKQIKELEGILKN